MDCAGVLVQQHTRRHNQPPMRDPREPFPGFVAGAVNTRRPRLDRIPFASHHVAQANAIGVGALSDRRHVISPSAAPRGRMSLIVRSAPAVNRRHIIMHPRPKPPNGGRTAPNAKGARKPANAPRMSRIRSIIPVTAAVQRRASRLSVNAYALTRCYSTTYTLLIRRALNTHPAASRPSSTLAASAEHSTALTLYSKLLYTRNVTGRRQPTADYPSLPQRRVANTLHIKTPPPTTFYVPNGSHTGPIPPDVYSLGPIPDVYSFPLSAFSITFGVPHV